MFGRLLGQQLACGANQAQFVDALVVDGVSLVEHEPLHVELGVQHLREAAAAGFKQAPAAFEGAACFAHGVGELGFTLAAGLGAAPGGGGGLAHLAAHGLLLGLLGLQFVDGLEDAVAQLEAIAEIPVQLHAIACAVCIENALGIAVVGDDGGQRGVALGLAALDFGTGTGDLLLDFLQLAAVAFGGLQGQTFLRGHPLPGHVQLGQPAVFRAEAKVARKAGQRIHALGFQRVLLGPCAGLARGGLAQVVAAHGTQLGTALFELGQLADDARGF